MMRVLLRTTRRAGRRRLAAMQDRLWGTIVGVRVERRLVALTFDDGPDPVTTPLVLDVLARHDARATFFMVGDAARRHPAVVARAAAEGHAIGHHTLEHVSLPGLPLAEVRRQIDDGFVAVGPSCSRLFRPPWGHLDLRAWRAARRSGHEVVAWNAHACDWTPQSARYLVQRLQAAVEPGAIILLHDAPQPGDDAETPRRELLCALDEFLGTVDRTWRFETVPTLLAAGRPQRQARWRTAPAETYP